MVLQVRKVFLVVLEDKGGLELLLLHLGVSTLKGFRLTNEGLPNTVNCHKGGCRVFTEATFF
jgi:hypothetical protein